MAPFTRSKISQKQVVLHEKTLVEAFNAMQVENVCKKREVKTNTRSKNNKPAERPPDANHNLIPGSFSRSFARPCKGRVNKNMKYHDNKRRMSNVKSAARSTPLKLHSPINKTLPPHLNCTEPKFLTEESNKEIYKWKHKPADDFESIPLCFSTTKLKRKKKAAPKMLQKKRIGKAKNQPVEKRVSRILGGNKICSVGNYIKKDVKVKFQPKVIPDISLDVSKSTTNDRKQNGKSFSATDVRNAFNEYINLNNKVEKLKNSDNELRMQIRSKEETYIQNDEKKFYISSTHSEGISTPQTPIRYLALRKRNIVITRSKTKLKTKKTDLELSKSKQTFHQAVDVQTRKSINEEPCSISSPPKTKEYETTGVIARKNPSTIEKLSFIYTRLSPVLSKRSVEGQTPDPKVNSRTSRSLLAFDVKYQETHFERCSAIRDSKTTKESEANISNVRRKSSTRAKLSYPCTKLSPVVLKRSSDDQSLVPKVKLRTSPNRTSSAEKYQEGHCPTSCSIRVLNKISNSRKESTNKVNPTNNNAKLSPVVSDTPFKDQASVPIVKTSRTCMPFAEKYQQGCSETFCSLTTSYKIDKSESTIGNASTKSSTKVKLSYTGTKLSPIKSDRSFKGKSLTPKENSNENRMAFDGKYQEEHSETSWSVSASSTRKSETNIGYARRKSSTKAKPSYTCTKLSPFKPDRSFKGKSSMPRENSHENRMAFDGKYQEEHSKTSCSVSASSTRKSKTNIGNSRKMSSTKANPTYTCTKLSPFKPDRYFKGKSSIPKEKSNENRMSFAGNYPEEHSKTGWSVSASSRRKSETNIGNARRKSSTKAKRRYTCTKLLPLEPDRSFKGNPSISNEKLNENCMSFAGKYQEEHSKTSWSVSASNTRTSETNILNARNKSSTKANPSYTCCRLTPVAPKRSSKDQTAVPVVNPRIRQNRISLIAEKCQEEQSEASCSSRVLNECEATRGNAKNKSSKNAKLSYTCSKLSPVASERSSKDQRAVPEVNSRISQNRISLIHEKHQEEEYCSIRGLNEIDKFETTLANAKKESSMTARLSYTCSELSAITSEGSPKEQTIVLEVNSETSRISLIGAKDEEARSKRSYLISASNRLNKSEANISPVKKNYSVKPRLSHTCSKLLPVGPERSSEDRRSVLKAKSRISKNRVSLIAEKQKEERSDTPCSTSASNSPNKYKTIISNLRNKPSTKAKLRYTCTKVSKTTSERSVPQLTTRISQNRMSLGEESENDIEIASKKSSTEVKLNLICSKLSSVNSERSSEDPRSVPKARISLETAETYQDAQSDGHNQNILKKSMESPDVIAVTPLRTSNRANSTKKLRNISKTIFEDHLHSSRGLSHVSTSSVRSIHCSQSQKKDVQQGIGTSHIRDSTDDPSETNGTIFEDCFNDDLILVDFDELSDDEVEHTANQEGIDEISFKQNSQVTSLAQSGNKSNVGEHDDIYSSVIEFHNNFNAVKGDHGIIEVSSSDEECAFNESSFTPDTIPTTSSLFTPEKLSSHYCSSDCDCNESLLPIEAPVVENAVASSELAVDQKGCSIHAMEQLDLTAMPAEEKLFTVSEDKEGTFAIPNLPFKKPKSVLLKPGKSWRRSLLEVRRSSVMLSSACICVADRGCICGCSKCGINNFQKPFSSAFDRQRSIRILPQSPLRTIRQSSNASILENYAALNISSAYGSNTTQDLVYPERSIGEPVTLKPKLSFLHEQSPNEIARDIVLRRCGQPEPIPFDECYPPSLLCNCFKIGEGVYGEVFLFRNASGGSSIMKVIPIEGNQLINGEQQKKFSEILSEIVIATELSNLRNGIKNKTNGFSEVQKIRCVQGCYPEKLLELWNIFEETRGSENDSPKIFEKGQLYVVLELANGGKDMEAFVFKNSAQAYALFQQTACALAVAESALEFEHRDLHWGNVLISHVNRNKKFSYCLNGRDLVVPACGVEVSIIDFTLSRIKYDGVVIYNDISKDPDLFCATGDYQFEIYKLMQERNGNKWEHFEPYSSILWLHYILEKMISALRYSNINRKIHKGGIMKLGELKDKILKYSSVNELVTIEFSL